MFLFREKLSSFELKMIDPQRTGKLIWEQSGRKVGRNINSRAICGIASSGLQEAAQFVLWNLAKLPVVRDCLTARLQG